MVNVTKQQLTNLFEQTSLTWEQMAIKFTAESEIKVTPKMVMDLFRANGFNPRSRARVSRKANWYTLIDDTSTNDTSGAEEVTEIGEDVIPEFA